MRNAERTPRPHTGGAATAARRGTAGRRRGRLFSLPRPLSFLSPLRPALLAAAVSLLSACGTEGGTFRIEGRFRNLNRGEFYVYSPDGGTDGRDTITIADGRFSYEVPLTSRATFILIFPNFSRQAVFGERGKTATIKADASHLREMEVGGTDDNELMTEFRLMSNRLSPPEVKKAVADFVAEHPESPVSFYLVNSSFIDVADPDYQTAARLLSLMHKADPENGRLELLLKQTNVLKASSAGSALPQFSAKDIDGRAVGRASLGGKANVVYVWSTWSYESQSVQRRLRQLKKKYGSRLGVVGISIDASPENCRGYLRTDSLPWPVVCDGRMWDTPLLSAFGLATVPGSIVADASGRIVARNLDYRRLEEQLEKMLGDGK